MRRIYAYASAHRKVLTNEISELNTNTKTLSESVHFNCL